MLLDEFITNHAYGKEMIRMQAEQDDLELRKKGLGFRGSGSGIRFRVYGFRERFRVWGFRERFRV